MTRKDFELIAATIRTANVLADARRVMANEFASALYIAAGYDVNGNRRFKTDRFLKACGVE